MTNQPKINIDADTIERVFVCEAQKEIERLTKENAEFKAALEYLQLNFPANECLQDKCREVLGNVKR